MEVAHTSVVSVWRRSTQRRSKKKTRFNKEDHYLRPPKHTPDHRFHGHVDAYMTSSLMKITIPDRPKTRHCQACDLNSKMSVSVFGNLDVRRFSISRTVSGPEVAAGWCEDTLNRPLDGRIMSRNDQLFCLCRRGCSGHRATVLILWILCTRFN